MTRSVKLPWKPGKWCPSRRATAISSRSISAASRIVSAVRCSAAKSVKVSSQPSSSAAVTEHTITGSPRFGVMRCRTHLVSLVAWSTYLLGQLGRRLQTVRIGEEFRELVPIGVAAEKEADDVGTPLRLEVRSTQVLEGQHFPCFGTKDDPEELVLTAENVSDGRTADSPANADPRNFLAAVRKSLDDAS